MTNKRIGIENEGRSRLKEVVNNNLKRLKTLTGVLGVTFMGWTLSQGGETKAANDQEALNNTLGRPSEALDFGIINNDIPKYISNLTGGKVVFKDWDSQQLESEDEVISAEEIEQSQTEVEPTEEPFSLNVTVRQEVNIRNIADGETFAPLSSRKTSLDVTAIGYVVPGETAPTGLPRKDQRWIVITTVNPVTGNEGTFMVIETGLQRPPAEIQNLEEFAYFGGQLIPKDEVPRPTPTVTPTGTNEPTQEIPATMTATTTPMVSTLTATPANQENSPATQTIQPETSRTPTPAPQETQTAPEIEPTITTEYRVNQIARESTWREITVEVDQNRLISLPLGRIVEGQVPAIDEIAQWSNENPTHPVYFHGIVLKIIEDPENPAIKFLTIRTKTDGGRDVDIIITTRTLLRVQPIDSQLNSINPEQIGWTSTTAVFTGEGIITGPNSEPILPGTSILFDVMEISPTDPSLDHTPEDISTMVNRVLNNLGEDSSFEDVLALIDSSQLRTERAVIYSFGANYLFYLE